MIKKITFFITAICTTCFVFLAILIVLPSEYANAQTSLTGKDCAIWDTVEFEDGTFGKASDFPGASIKACVYGSNTAKNATGATEDTVNLKPEVLSEKAIALIQFVLGFLSLIAVAMIIYGGFTWMTSGGNETVIGKARKILFAALLGLLIVAGAWLIVTFVVQTTYETFAVK